MGCQLAIAGDVFDIKKFIVGLYFTNGQCLNTVLFTIGDRVKQIDLIPEIKRLCRAGHYCSAIRLTSEIEDKGIAVKAHLLCIEHEEAQHIKRQNHLHNFTDSNTL